MVRGENWVAHGVDTEIKEDATGLLRKGDKEGYTELLTLSSINGQEILLSYHWGLPDQYQLFQRREFHQGFHSQSRP